MEGALIVNKPAGWTSHDVVARLRHLSGERSIGHLGTLDPAATGVLPLLLGGLTRLAQYFQGRDKEYIGEIRFGFATDTYDALGEPLGAVSDAPSPPRAEVEAALDRFRGAIEQTPPPYSAKKVGGTRAYKLARQRQSPLLTPKRVEIHQLTILGYGEDRLRIRLTCSSGTYVRSLAHDLGQILGVGGHLAALERVRVGEFTLAVSHSLEELVQRAADGTLPQALLSPAELLPEFPAVTAPPEAEAKLLQGRAANLAEFSEAAVVRVFARSADGELRLLALARRIAGTLFHPQTVFPI